MLTQELAKRAAKVVSIEVDERLPPLLAETMAGVDNFKLVLQDVLKVDLKALIAAEFPGCRWLSAPTCPTISPALLS